MKRRVFLAGLAAPLVAADPADEMWRVVAGMAAALAEGNAPAFLRPIAARFPHRDSLKADVEALIQIADLESVVEDVSNDGDANQRKLVVSWQLKIKRKTADQVPVAPVVRLENVAIVGERTAKRWEVTAIDPARFFAPPEFGG